MSAQMQRSAQLDRTDFLLTVVFCYMCNIIEQISCLSTPSARIERRNLPVVKSASFFNPQLSHSKWGAVFSGVAAQQSSVGKFYFVPPVLSFTGASCISCGVDTVSSNALSMNHDLCEA